MIVQPAADGVNATDLERLCPSDQSDRRRERGSLLSAPETPPAPGAVGPADVPGRNFSSRGEGMGAPSPAGDNLEVIDTWRPIVHPSTAEALLALDKADSARRGIGPSLADAMLAFARTGGRP